jgi:hypothetical protein
MPNSQARSNSSSRTVPVHIVAGVTGHRRLNPKPGLAEAIHKGLEEYRKIMRPSRDTPLVITVLSPLAEGADRIVAREVLKIPGSMLKVVLPFKKKDYTKDFETYESKREFEELLSQARSVKQLPAKRSRNEAYEQAGRYIVDHCDVLIALWDGKPALGQGGTGEIVAYARNKKRPLIWINVEHPARVTFEL